MLSVFDSIEALKGVGAKRAQLYKKVGVESIYSLLNYFPRTYIDYSEACPISETEVGQAYCVHATVFKKQGEQRIRKGLSVYKVFVTDGSDNMVITIFNSKYAFENLKLEHEYYFYGKVQGTVLRREMNSPTFIDPKVQTPIKAIYHLTDGLTNNIIASNIKSALEVLGDIPDDALPESIKRKENLCHIRYAYENIHFPKDNHALNVAKERFVFEELLTLQLGLALLKNKNREKTAIKIKDTDLSSFYSLLPFELTDGQKEAINDGLCDFKKDIPMNRLVQGDVGSGKTMVASALCYCMAQNGYQSAVMAPTELLARQHFESFCRLFKDTDIRCCLLTGSATPKQKADLKEKIANSEYDIVIGTHALIQSSVSFKKLGLVVTDEQHRFGVNQRFELSKKGENPHRLVMSATPIPRTLALIIYGDLDISSITKLPHGRQPILTYAIDSEKRLRALNFIKKHIDEGFQAYLVCPLIEESESGMMSISEYESYIKKSPLGKYRFEVLHGKLKPDKKDKVMADFKEHKLDFIISTTVIEVGIDVPSAVIMMIENAERFGLSQLHQLRGRVGRGSLQSYCILVSDNKQKQSIDRLKIMTKSSDGFYIAEQDLKLRGPGDFFGEKQHGLPRLKIANMIDDMSTLMKTRQIAFDILSSDPTLSSEQNNGLKLKVSELFNSDTGA